MTLKYYPLIEYYISNIFLKNHAENVHQMLVPDFFLILINKPKQPLHVRNFLENKIYFKRGFSKSLKKVNFIFSFKPSPF